MQGRTYLIEYYASEEELEIINQVTGLVLSSVSDFIKDSSTLSEDNNVSETLGRLQKYTRSYLDMIHLANGIEE
jgi:hypothetical protein